MNRRKLLALLPSLLVIFVVANLCCHLAQEFAAVSRTFLPSDPITAALVKPNLILARPRLIIHDPQPFPLPSPSPTTESVLFPDWEVFVLLPPGVDPRRTTSNFTCVFINGATSPANYTGLVPSSGRHGFLCRMPTSVRRLRPFRTPQIVAAASGAGTGLVSIGSDRMTEMMRWNRLAYDSYSTDDDDNNDVIVFAKGINRNQGKDRPVEDVSCVFTVNGAVVDVTNSTSSAQEVFRCPHPSSKLFLSTAAGRGDDARISIRVAGEESPIPSLAVYRPPPPLQAAANEYRVDGGSKRRRELTCACTMVYNAAKFLREWVTYHAAVGVDRFVLYDNGSDDDLAAVVAELAVEGYDVSSMYWPWQKTQEAGFSHCAASQRDACEWMAFIDVDEFLYSPSWSESPAPNKSMIMNSAIGGADGRKVGQVEVACVDFGPSGQRAHPLEGVTQGYTCRARAKGRLQRHKSLVRLDAVGHGLRNSVHHFELGPKWETKKAKGAVVNHYKYQAWSEFKLKFRRRVSAYVADWKEKRNQGSKDRTPGLGFSDEVEPDWWARGRCHVRDTGLRDLVRRWFAGPTRSFAWEQ